MVYTLAAQLITSCPSSNAMLPVKAYPPLTVTKMPIFNAAAGTQVNLMYKGSDSSSGSYAAIYNGLGSTVVQIGDGGSVTLPEGIQGYSYILVTSASDIASVSSECSTPSSFG